MNKNYEITCTSTVDVMFTVSGFNSGAGLSNSIGVSFKINGSEIYDVHTDAFNPGVLGCTGSNAESMTPQFYIGSINFS